jgi:gluconokinase
MAAGIPLTDEDRAPWLRDLADWIAERDRATKAAVVTCSALKRVYRDVLRRASPRLVFLHLTGPREVIAERIQQRPDHFMPVSLLDSQLSALEPLEADERGIVLEVCRPPAELADIALDALSRLAPPRAC